MFNKLKLVTWADLLYLVTLAYIITLIVLSSWNYQVWDKKHQKHNITYLTYLLTQHKELWGIKGKILLGSMFIVAIIIDRILIKTIWVRFTKQYKVAQYAIDKEYSKIAKEKDNEKNTN